MLIFKSIYAKIPDLTCNRVKMFIGCRNSNSGQALVRSNRTFAAHFDENLTPNSLDTWKSFLTY